MNAIWLNVIWEIKSFGEAYQAVKLTYSNPFIFHSQIVSYTLCCNWAVCDNDDTDNDGIYSTIRLKRPRQVRELIPGKSSHLGGPRGLKGASRAPKGDVNTLAHKMKSARSRPGLCACSLCNCHHCSIVIIVQLSSLFNCHHWKCLKLTPLL